MNMNTFQTSDIGIAAFVMMKGLRLQQASKGHSGRFLFVFLDDQHQGQQYAVDYVNSESAKFDANMKNLKNILYKS
jgi:hypothetical protein